MARINPGESPTSYIAQGLLDFMSSGHALAAALRDHVTLKVIPMINPDGVFLGNYRTNLMGYDLNRNWNQVSPWSHPTLFALKNYLIDLDASKSVELDMIIDLHAHASLMGTFIYGNSYDDVYRSERHILFPKLLAHNAEDYNPTNTMYNRDPSKGGAARRHLCDIMRSTVNVYTLEVSYFGYNQPLSNSVITYNEDGYLRLGRNLARTMFDYYKVTGVIPASVVGMGLGGVAGPQHPQSDESKRKKGKLVRKKSTRASETPRSESRERSPSYPNEAVVKLPQLTKNNSDSNSDTPSEDEDVQLLRATRNGHIFHHQIIKSREKRGGGGGSTTQPPPPPPTTATPNKSREKQTPKVQTKAAYATFDFSGLRSKDGNRSTPPRTKRYTHRRSKGEGGERGRKIGGGGIIGTGKIKNPTTSHQPQDKEELPCLTIIDFNMLIRKGGALDGRRGGEGELSFIHPHHRRLVVRGGGWRGGRRRQLAPHGTQSDGGSLGVVRTRRTPRIRNGGGGGGQLTDWEEDSSSSSPFSSDTELIRSHNTHYNTS